MTESDLPLALRIRGLNNQIRRRLERSAIARNDADLTGLQYAVLGYLGERGSATSTYQRDIEAEFNVRRSTASGMLQTLEREGYIERIRDTEDTRLKRIVMTDKAKELDTVARQVVVELQDRLTAGISDSEMQQFYATLDRIAHNAAE